MRSIINSHKNSKKSYIRIQLLLIEPAAVEAVTARVECHAHQSVSIIISCAKRILFH